MVVFQKLEGKTTTLNFWNQKNGRKFYYSQKLCFDRIFEIKKMEGNPTTPKNCVLTEFLKSKNRRKFYYSQKLCFDRIFAWKKYNFPSGFLTNTILNYAQECVFQKVWKLLLSKIRRLKLRKFFTLAAILKRNVLKTTNFSFDG